MIRGQSKGRTTFGPKITERSLVLGLKGICSRLYRSGRAAVEFELDDEAAISGGHQTRANPLALARVARAREA